MFQSYIILKSLVFERRIICEHFVEWWLLIYVRFQGMWRDPIAIGVVLILFHDDSLGSPVRAIIKSLRTEWNSRKDIDIRYIICGSLNNRHSMYSLISSSVKRSDAPLISSTVL